MKSVEALRKWADGLRDIWINPNDNSIIVTACDDMPPSTPTVEDVLREFADRVCNSGHQWGLDAADTIAEYAAKLRLAGEE